MLAIWSFACGCVLVWRRELLANEYNRRWLQFILGALTALTLHRGVAIAAGTTPTQIIASDLAICGCAFLTGSSLSRLFRAIGLLMFGLALVAAWEPASARAIINFAGLGSAVVMWWLWRHGRPPVTADH